MASMDDYNILIKLLELECKTHRPCIMSFGKAESKERIKGYQLGVQDYLT